MTRSFAGFELVGALPGAPAGLQRWSARDAEGRSAEVLVGGAGLAGRAAGLPTQAPFVEVRHGDDGAACWVVVPDPVQLSLPRLRGTLTPAAVFSLGELLLEALTPLHAAGRHHGRLHPGGIGFAADGSLWIRPLMLDAALAGPKGEGPSAAGDCYAVGAILRYLLGDAWPPRPTARVSLAGVDSTRAQLLLDGLLRTRARWRLSPARSALQTLRAVLRDVPDADAELAAALAAQGVAAPDHLPLPEPERAPFEPPKRATAPVRLAPRVPATPLTVLEALDELGDDVVAFQSEPVIEDDPELTSDFREPLSWPEMPPAPATPASPVAFSAPEPTTVPMQVLADAPPAPSEPEPVEEPEPIDAPEPEPEDEPEPIDEPEQQPEPVEDEPIDPESVVDDLSWHVPDPLEVTNEGLLDELVGDLDELDELDEAADEPEEGSEQPEAEPEQEPEQTPEPEPEPVEEPIDDEPVEDAPDDGEMVEDDILEEEPDEADDEADDEPEDKASAEPGSEQAEIEPEQAAVEPPGAAPEPVDEPAPAVDDETLEPEPEQLADTADEPEALDADPVEDLDELPEDVDHEPEQPVEELDADEVAPEPEPVDEASEAPEEPQDEAVEPEVSEPKLDEPTAETTARALDAALGASAEPVARVGFWAALTSPIRALFGGSGNTDDTELEPEPVEAVEAPVAELEAPEPDAPEPSEDTLLEDETSDELDEETPDAAAEPLEPEQPEQPEPEQPEPEPEPELTAGASTEVLVALDEEPLAPASEELHADEEPEASEAELLDAPEDQAAPEADLPTSDPEPEDEQPELPSAEPELPTAEPELPSGEQVEAHSAVLPPDPWALDFGPEHDEPAEELPAPIEPMDPEPVAEAPDADDDELETLAPQRDPSEPPPPLVHDPFALDAPAAVEEPTTPTPAPRPASGDTGSILDRKIGDMPAWSLEGAPSVTANHAREQELGAGKWTESGRSLEEIAKELPSTPTRELSIDGGGPPWGLILVGIAAVAAVAFFWMRDADPEPASEAPVVEAPTANLQVGEVRTVAADAGGPSVVVRAVPETARVTLDGFDYGVGPVAIPVPTDASTHELCLVDGERRDCRDVTGEELAATDPYTFEASWP